MPSAPATSTASGRSLVSSRVASNLSGAAMLLAIFTICALSWTNADRALDYYVTSARCAEDQPCWNWRTMGNHQRGIVLTNGRRLVVNPLSFDGYRRERRIDWTRTPRLRGDDR